jgi:hypothetical protein
MFLLPLCAAAIIALPTQQAFALIVGGEGNKPVNDPGWPKGGAVLFNKEARIAWWEGPPFGGGQWHAECRGAAQTLSSVLADFAELDVKSKRVVVHDGVGRSFWLNPNDDPAKREAARMDWVFMVWVPGNWQRLRKLPADLNPTGDSDAEDGPPAQIDVYTGGNIKWADVVVPKGIKIIDQRLEAHGFTLADGIVLEGKVTDLATKKPIAAKIRLERIEPQPKGGGYRYSSVAEAAADADGHWVLKKAPAGSYRVVIEAPGFVPRVAGHARFDDQPRWQAYDSGLARPAPVAGRITGDAGEPLADVEVRIADVTAAGGRYESPLEYSCKTGKDGRFRAEQIPLGKATIWVHKPGYTRPGLGEPITTPKDDVELRMTKAARVEVTVDFTGTERPKGYIVRIEPEGGDKVGSFGGSGNINAKNQIIFENVPPGRYTFTGQPNPGSSNQQTDPVTIEVKGGQTAKITLSAK